MSIHPPKVVHFNSSPNSNQINTSTSTQFIPWSERYPKLLKLFNVLTHSNHFNLSNHILNSSPHLNSIHHQLHHHHQNQLHELNHNLGSLIEYSNQLLNSKDHHPSSIEIKLFKRVIQFKLDPNTDFIKIRQLSSSECGQVELVKSRLSKDELRNQRNVFVLKTIYKSAAIRMRDHISADAELAILQLSRSSETNQTSSIQGILPNLRASFQSSDALYILTSYLPGGTLSDLISQRQENKSNPIQDHEYEKIVKQWVSEIVLGLNWLHTTHLWVHRDLKPSNILLSLDGHIVLNDFGTAAPLLKVQAPLLDQYHFEKYHEENWYDFPRLLVPKSYSRTLVGTCDYIAPEILHSHLHTVMDLIDSDSESTTSTDELNDHEVGGLYGNEVDWWSLGVTVYELLYGSLPFYSASISTTYEMIVSHQNFLSFPNSSSMIPTCNISFDAKDFIKSLLTDPHKRLGCDSTGVIQIQTHPWFKGIDWSIIRTVKPLYKPANTPLEIEPEEISMGIPASAVPGKAAAAFNFSAFFASSPGLSVLRSMKKPNQNPKRIEEEEEEEEEENERKEAEEMFNGFTLLPNLIDEFEVDEEIGFGITSEKKLKSSLSSSNRIGMIQDGFITPIRPKLKFENRIGTGTGTGTGTGRTGRGMSDLEEWKELVDLVTMTAQKKKNGEKFLGGLGEEDEDEDEKRKMKDRKVKVKEVKVKEGKVEVKEVNLKVKEDKMRFKERKPKRKPKPTPIQPNLNDETQLEEEMREKRDEDQLEDQCEGLMKEINSIIEKYKRLFKCLEDEDYYQT